MSNTMIDRELLQDMGFVRGTGGWPGETWVYEGSFWVHFYQYRPKDDETSVNALLVPRAEFFKKFLTAMVFDEPDYR